MSLTTVVAVCGAVLTSVSWSLLTAHSVQSWPLQAKAAFHAFTVGTDLLLWCLKDLLPTCKTSPRIFCLVSQVGGERCIELQ